MAASEEQNRLNTEQTQDGELEQYGVWVKAGPEDVDESEAEDEAFTLTDLGDDELDEAELDILGLDSLEEADAEPVVEEDLGEEIELDALDIDDESPFSSSAEPQIEPDLESETEPEALSSDETDIDELLTIEEDEISLEFDDESSDETEPTPVAEPELGGLESSSDDVVDLDDGIDLDGGIDIDDELPGSLDDLTLDLDSLDVDSFDEPTTSDITSDITMDEPAAEVAEVTELADVSEEADELEELNLEEDELNLEEDELDLESLSLGDDEEEADTEVAELDLSTLPGDDDEFGSLSPEDLEPASEDELPELEADDEEPFEASLDESFDDVGAVEEEMLSAATPPAPDDQSRSLLESIERELGSIRTELSDLKRELSQLREEPTRTIEITSETEEEAGGGFFEDDDEDEDETIALTGAELDNIMNTAEFTEETGRSTDLDDLLREHPVEPEPEPEIQTESDAVQEITLEEAPEDFGTIDLDLDGPGEDPQEADSRAHGAPDGLFGGSDEDVEALASMDIDAELSDIEDLDDEEPAAADSFEEVAAESETPAEDQAGIDLIFDAEPLDLEEDLELEEDLVLEEELEVEEELEIEPEVTEPAPTRVQDEVATPSEPTAAASADGDAPIPENLKGELRSVLNYMDKLLDSLPEEKIQEFAASEHFKVYKRLFEELGLEQ